MEEFMDVDWDNNHLHDAAPSIQPETRKRKHVVDIYESAPSTWQMLHTVQDRLFDKIDRTLAQGNFELLPLPQSEYATLQKWEEFQASLSNHRQ
jgi:hypothetical protein